MKASIGVAPKDRRPQAINVYLRDHPIGTVVHSVGRATHGTDRWYIEHPRDPRPLDDSDFFSNPDDAAVSLITRLGWLKPRAVPSIPAKIRPWTPPDGDGARLPLGIVAGLRTMTAPAAV